MKYLSIGTVRDGHDGYLETAIEVLRDRYRMR